MTDLTVSQVIRTHNKANRLAPNICGVTWSPNGTLYYFNNLAQHIDTLKSQHNTTDLCLPGTLSDFDALPVQINDIKLQHQSTRQITYSPLLELNNDIDILAVDRSVVTTPIMSRNASSIEETDTSDVDSIDDELNSSTISTDYIKSIYNASNYNTNTTETKQINYTNNALQRVFYTNNDLNNSHDNNSDNELIDLTLHRRASIQSNHAAYSPLNNRLTPKLQSQNHLKYTSINTDIAIFDLQCVLLCDLNLAQHYKCVIDENNTIDQICTHNANLCDQYNRTDISDTWLLVQHLFQPMKSINDYDDQQYYPYALSNNGGLAIQALINQYANIGDIQHAALIASLYIQMSQLHADHNTTDTAEIVPSSSKSNLLHSKLQRAASELHIQPSRKLVNSQSYAQNLSRDDTYFVQQQLRTAHSSNNIAHNASFRITPPITPRGDTRIGSHSQSFLQRISSEAISELSDSHDYIDMMEHSIDVNDMYKSLYAEYLYRNGSVQQRSEILKSCYTCGDYDMDECTFDVKYDNTVSCVICNEIVRGSTLSCLQCEHSGHTTHLTEWFANVSSYCASGCGCQCVFAN